MNSTGVAGGGEIHGSRPRVFDTWCPRVLAVLRILTGYLFLQHGTAKLLGVPVVEMFKAGVPLLSGASLP